MTSTRSNRKFQIVLSGDYADRWDALARENGCLWGDRGNVKKLASLIGDRVFTIVPDETVWAPEQQRIVEKIVPVLQDLIKRKVPFTFCYKSSSGLKEMKAQYAEITFRERRRYLEVWSNNVEDSRDIEELAHNWSFPLDRILSASPAKGKWRKNGLDTLDVVLELRGGLAGAYRFRPGDEPLGVEEGKLRVRRTINSTFWLIRSIMPYAEDCVVLEPDSVRKQIAAKLKAAANNY